MPAHQKLLIGVAIGIGFGVAANILTSAGAPLAYYAGDLEWIVAQIVYPVGQIFLRLLFMLVIPLLFGALVMGLAELDLQHLGRIGLKMVIYTLVVSSIAVGIGLGLVNWLQPGIGVGEGIRELAIERSQTSLVPAPTDNAGSSFIVSLIPDNPIKAAASGDMIGVIAFSLIFGIGLMLTQTPAAARLREGIQGLYEVMMRLIDGVLRLAPIGVGALLFAMTSRLGVDLLVQLAAYVAVVLLGLGLHMFVVYSASVKFFGGRSPVAFFRDIWLAIVTAFSTASSSATLPTALKVADEKLKLPRHVSRFVLTAGSTMNQNGTALFEGVTVLFLAQLFNVELLLIDQIGIMGLCVLAGIGTAGVPAGSLPVIAMILGMYNIPPEGLALILGVDRILDMCRTTLNVAGDLAAAVFVARGETDPAPSAAVGALANDQK